MSLSGCIQGQGYGCSAHWREVTGMAYSDMDVLAVAPSQGEADQLADAVLSAGLADDALALSKEKWEQRRYSGDPYWRAIGRDAICLIGPNWS